MPAVVHEQLEDQRRAVAVPLDDRDALDVALRFRDRGRDLREYAHAVRDLDLDLDVEQPVGGCLPGDGHPFLRLLAEGRQVPARLAMDHDATPAREVGEHRIVRNGEAAARVGHDQALRAGDRERPPAPRDAVTRIGRQQPARDEGCNPLAEADLLEELLGAPQPELLHDRLDSARRELAQAERELLERLVQESPAQLHGLPALQVLEVLADRGARFCGDHEVRPGRIWRRALGGDDFDGLAVTKRRAQRNQPPIDLRRDAAVADVGVHGIGKVDTGRAARQAAYFALGREHVNLVREQVDLDALEKLLRATALLDLDELLQPLARAIAVRAIARVARLVLPVRRDARLRNLVHVLGTDLHLDRHPVRTKQRRVQRLVAVCPGDGDVVLEPPRHRLVHAVHAAKRAVAGIDGLDHDTEPVHVDDLAERDLLAPHLLVDAVRILLTSLDARADCGPVERRSQRIRDSADHLFLVALGTAHRVLDDTVAARIHRAEAEILELGLDRMHAEPVCDRRVDVERLARNGASLRERHGAQRAHVVRAIGELDHDHANVAHHREQHLAEALGLRFLAALELDLVELADAVYEVGHFLAEPPVDLLLERRRVLDHVVEDRCDQRLRIEPQVREQIGDGDRVRYVRLAGAATLALVSLEGEVIRILDAFDLGGREIALELRDELADAYGPSSIWQQAAQGRRDVHKRGRCSGISLPTRSAAPAARPGIRARGGVPAAGGPAPRGSRDRRGPRRPRAGPAPWACRAPSPGWPRRHWRAYGRAAPPPAPAGTGWERSAGNPRR